ncbi:MAG: ribosome silencing factor [Phycisphaerae bacterium]|nr:ribosome silencing factor [Phycisphaerae bacterium]MDG1899439.1 ribosome silencing factor [Phycisphaerales bacterium]|tara:strand:+ start:31604 stop:31996 length:393 start_codon:yes stop_codon:yes gene_type:complete
MTETQQGSTNGEGQASESSLGFAVEAARLLEDLHCTDVRLLDLRGISQVCDFILVGSGTSDRQMRSVADEVGTLGKSHGAARFRTNNDPASTWIVVDFVDVVVHLFEPSRRAYYDLEDLWSDSEVVDFTR